MATRWPFVALTALSFVVAEPCGMAWRPSDRAAGQPVVLSREQAVIIWNPRTGTEHFIRQAEFETLEKDFGFLVPVPSIPKTVAVGLQAFDELTDFVEETLWARQQIQTLGDKGARSGGAGGAGVPPPVTVHSVTRVGDYVATVLSGTDAQSVADWLAENGYTSRPALTEYLDHYVKKEWYFVAFRFDGDPRGSIATKAVRLTFQTRKPFYPYKAPTDNWPADNVKPLTVYFLSTSGYRARFEGSKKEWEAARVLQAELPPYLTAEVCRSFKLAERQVPEFPVMTVFRNSKDTEGYGEDVVFDPEPR